MMIREFVDEILIRLVYENSIYRVYNRKFYEFFCAYPKGKIFGEFFDDVRGRLNFQSLNYISDIEFGFLFSGIDSSNSSRIDELD